MGGLGCHIDGVALLGPSIHDHHEWLNRIEEARFNYLRLYALNKGQAAKLLQAMRAWVETHRASAPNGADVNAFAEWVAQRTELTRNDVVSTSW